MYRRLHTGHDTTPRLVPGLLALLVLVGGAPTMGWAYDCNVHNDRPIAPSVGAQTRMISLRDECFAADASSVPSFPICECVNTGTIVSDPMATSCPASGRYIELGRCVAAKRYYEVHIQIQGYNAPYEADPRLHRAFVPNPDVCEPCAHDVVSSVLGCKALCRRYFTKRFFDPMDFDQHQAGSWRIENADGSNNNNYPLTPIPTLDHFRICDVNTNPLEVDPCPSTQEGRALAGVPTAMEVCERRCGPPNHENPDTDAHWEKPGDNWWFVNYRKWNPNDRLDRWIRSYNNVNDRPDPPAGECVKFVAEYCEYLRDLLGLTTGPVYQCKKNLLIRRLEIEDEGTGVAEEPFIDFHGPTFDFTDIVKADPFRSTPTGMRNDGFCDHLRRGNNECPQTCSLEGSDGFSNEWHHCEPAGNLQPQADCVQPVLNVDPSRPELRGGAVCNKPPVELDYGYGVYYNTTRGAKYNTVHVVSPAKGSTTDCNATRTVLASTVTLAFNYQNQYPAAGESAAYVALLEMAKAKWKNMANGRSGDLTFGAYGLWYTDVPVQLETGVNRIVATFTDRQLRTSGDAIDILH